MAATGAVSRGVQRARDLASRDTPLGSTPKDRRSDPVARPGYVWCRSCGVKFAQEKRLCRSCQRAARLAAAQAKAQPTRIWRQWPSPLPSPEIRPTLYERVIDGEVLAVVWDGRVR